MNKLQMTTEMRKRGLVLLVLIAVFLVTIVLTSAAPTAGTCTHVDDENFCIYVESKEKCTLPEYFAEGKQPEETTECQQGCCLCTDGIDYVTDTTYAYGGPITTEQQCSRFCSDINMQMDFNLSIKEIDKCVAQLQEYETAELSGYVYDMLGNVIKNAVVKVDDNETNTSDSGHYRLIDLRPMPGQTIVVRHDSYVTNITQFDIKPGDNSLDFKLVSAEKGSVAGYVFDSAGIPLSRVSVAIEGISDVTKPDGSYILTGIQKFQPNIISAYLSNYAVERKTVTITDDFAVVNFTLMTIPIAVVYGGVLEEAGGVDGALVTFSNENFPSRSARSLANGNFYIPDLAIYEGGAKYTISAEKTGYYPSVIEQVLVPGDNDVSIELVPHEPSCGIETAVAVKDFSASDVRGKKALLVTWSNPCRIVAGYYLYKDSELLKYIDVTPRRNYFEYLDEDVEWGLSYTYKIIAVYDIAGESDEKTASETLGNSLCEGRFGEFCSENIYRKKCNEYNDVEDIETCYENYFCAGPDNNLKTYCKSAEKCSVYEQDAWPFGLYYKSIDSCWGRNLFSSEEQSENYCYYDYSNTIVDKCYSCNTPELTSCFDYKSELACELDSQTCMKGEGSVCGWVYTLQELGKGLCYKEGYDGTDKCNLCREDSLFFNANCNQGVCSKLGRCYANEEESSCIECEETRCEDYTTKKQCGSRARTIACGEITDSDDACNLGVCRWDEEDQACFKDSNADGNKDCISDVVCQKDTVPAESKIVDEYIAISTENTKITFEIKDNEPATIYYCIYSDLDTPCCDFKTTGKELDLSSGGWYASGENVYYIRYYSVDGHNNQEQIKTRRIYADIEDPIITVSSSVAPKGDNGDLTIDIISNEPVTCTDNLELLGGGSSKQRLKDSMVNLHEAVLYENLAFDTYEYHLDCSDDAGNFVEKKLWITVDNPFITIIKPGKVTRETAFNFAVSTLEQSTCKLFYQNNVKEDMQSSNGLSHSTLGTYPFAANKQYAGYSVRCESSGETKKQDILFTVDTLPPITSALLGIPGVQRTKTGNAWEESFSDVDYVVLDFECNDYPETGFGCVETTYCINETGFCKPDIKFSGELIELASTAKVCYFSSDGNNDDELTKCGTVYVDRTIGAKIIEPSYGVSNTLVFDILIETTKPALSCKYQPFDLYFDYDSIQFSKFIFNFIDEWNFKKTNFPKLLWGYGFTATNADNYETGEPHTYNMYVKCKDFGGEVSDEPSYFELRYDATPPVIVDNYVGQGGKRLGSGEVITENLAVLNVITDDETICRHDKTETEYDLMNNYFYGSDLSEFKTAHLAVIEHPEDKKTHTYHVQCMNKAESLSATIELSFDVDRDMTGMIKSAEADVNGDVEFTAVTNRKAVCSYSDGISGIFDTDAEGFVHTMTSDAYTDEGAYSLDVSCLFATGITAEIVINFVIDKTPPVMANITIGNYVCDTEKIRPTFVAEDELSGIKEYEYELKKKFGIVIKEDTVSGSRPTIRNLDLEIGAVYELRARATDDAGNTGEWLSVEFTVEDEDSPYCEEDENPEVYIKETLNTDNTKDVEIICNDESSCVELYYGTGTTSGKCSATKEYKNTLLIDHTIYLCYEAIDSSGNKITGYKKIIISDFADSDEDGIPDSEDMCDNTPYAEIYEVINDSSSPNYGCSKSEIDSDSDGMPDYWEIRYNLDPHNPDDKYLDLDNDGISNYDEYMAHTDPTMADAADSDSDGVADSADDCPYTPFGASVDEYGCSASQKDIDGDGIENTYDKCDHTPYNEINDVITDPSDEYYGCSPSERPSSKLLALILLTFGLILVIGGISYLIYVKYVAGKRGFKSILKKQRHPEVKILRAVAPRPARQQIKHIAPARKTPGAEERRKKAIAEIRKRITEKRKRKKMFKEFEKK